MSGQIADHSVTRQKLAIKGEPGVGKVITLDENGDLHWARIAVVDGGVRLLVDNFGSTLTYVNPTTGERRVEEQPAEGPFPEPSPS